VLIHRALSIKYSDGPLISYPDQTYDTEQVHIILGESGVGKSTWLQLVAGFRILHVHGRITLHDERIDNLSKKERDAHRAKHIGIIHQEPIFIEALSVRKNLKLASRLARSTTENQQILTVLNSLECAELIDKKPNTLSTGQRQRVAIARAVLSSPSLLIADEPTSALDDTRAEAVNLLLRDQAKRLEAVLIIITHDRRIIKSDDHIINLERS